MEIRIAKEAGFCYGVKRAVEIAQREAAAAGGCWCLGNLIHNQRETGRLEALGLKKAVTAEDIPDGATVIIRSHGEPDSVYQRLEEKGCRIVDATCPNVARIHKLVREAAARGRIPIVFGDGKHPEVRGICGSAPGVLVFKDGEELEDWLEKSPLPPETPVTVVFQTTEVRERVTKCD